MKHWTYLLIFTIIACTNQQQKVNGPDTLGSNPITTEKDNENIAEKEQAKATIINKQDYFYYPEISIISGTIQVESFFGPPGYGDNPETDSREDCYILNLEDSINVISKNNEIEEGNFDYTKYNIYKIQLISSSTTGVKLLNDINKKVRLTGTLYGAFSGHNHADV